MPTITAQLFDMGRLIGENMTVEQLQEALALVKAEVKSHDAVTGELRIDLADGNRPDLWSPEGVARQIRSVRQGKGSRYGVFSNRIIKKRSRLEVDPELQDIRPYIAGFSVRGLKVTEESLVGMIEAQEKLSEVFGRRRKAIAIGVYNARRIAWPVHYRAVRPDGRRFVPLGLEEELDLSGILEKHPKGQQYARLLDGFALYPFLEDAKGRVLSFPPVINSADAGMVKVGDSHLFVEVTGTDLRTVMLSINIFAANLIDRGGRVTPCDVVYPFDTPLGRTVTTPANISEELEVPFEVFEKLLGQDVERTALKKAFAAYGVKARTKGKSAFLTLPPWRDDYLHPHDAVEDYAIAVGYDAFAPQPMADFTAGKLDAITAFGDTVRDLLTGMGFEEIISNVLTSPTRVRDRMARPRENMVEIDNFVSETYSVVRDSILPSLLEVEAASSKAAYPHRIFEEGEVSVRDGGSLRTRNKAAALVAHPEANFSEVHSFLNLLAYYLDIDVALTSADLDGYIPGRCAEIRVGGGLVGVIGEVHPEVLENWGIKNPVAGFEIDLSALSPTEALS